MPTITLIRTANHNGLGSMSAYADMVHSALSLSPPSDWMVRVCTALGRDGRGPMWMQHIWRLINMDRELRGHPTDLYHLMDGSMAGFLSPSVPGRVLVSLHDFFPLRQLRGELPGRQSRPAAWLVRRTLRILRRCSGHCANSEATRNDAARFIGAANIPVIPLAVKYCSLPATGSAAHGVHDSLPARFILHVGHNAPYKNRKGALAVFARLRDIPDLHLMMAGAGPTRDLKRMAATVGAVTFVVNPDDAALACLYARARLLLFPSLCEGFGMPVAEAMSLGCPVVCSSAAALPEVAGDAALMAAPEDVDALAVHCRSVLTDKDLRLRLIMKGCRRAGGFSLSRMGSDLWDWYRDVWESRRG